MSDAEVPLAEERVTSVVRVGNTVRRPPRMNGEFVHALLDHLAAVDFDGAPRFLGTDEQGRDILSYLEGEVPADLELHDDVVLFAAGRLIRRFHDATIGILARGTSARLEVVCHNDLSPCNCVFRIGIPVAMIDFDTAAPGTRRMDIGYAAWCWLDLGNPEIAPAEQRRRLELFVTAYGIEFSAASVKEAILTRQQMLAAEAACTGKDELAQWARASRTWTMENL
jgi:aminoglycoside phosphotransferase (APT) family kinase protein